MMTYYDPLNAFQVRGRLILSLFYSLFVCLRRRLNRLVRCAYY